jgi:hypothetical protein
LLFQKKFESCGASVLLREAHVSRGRGDRHAADRRKNKNPAVAGEVFVWLCK